MKKHSWLTIANLFGSSFLLVGCGFLATALQPAATMTPSPEPTLTIAEIEKYARITMPASATDIHTYLSAGWLDDAILVRFNLPPTDLDAFLAQAGYTEPLKEQWAPPMSALDSMSWWFNYKDYGENSTRVFAGLKVNEAQFTRNILVDKTDPAEYVVYLKHFEG